METSDKLAKFHSKLQELRIQGEELLTELSRNEDRLFIMDIVDQIRVILGMGNYYIPPKSDLPSEE